MSYDNAADSTIPRSNKKHRLDDDDDEAEEKPPKKKVKNEVPGKIAPLSSLK